MKETTITITIPDGYDDIDKEALAEGKISFVKAKPTTWRCSNPKVNGFYINADGHLMTQVSLIPWNECSHHIFATKKQRGAMLAMAQLSQIIKHDKRFGGPITNEEWKKGDIPKYVIVRSSDELRHDLLYRHYHFLSFHTSAQRDLFFEENKDLIKQYYMLD